MDFSSRERLERTARKLVLIAAFITAGLWLGGKAGFFDFSKDTLLNLQGSWLALMWIKILLDARSRRLGEADPGLDEPHPAVMLTIVIVLTGAAGVFAAIKGGPDASTSVPYLIAIGTVLLAILGFTLAAKHKDKIGEARFPSQTDQN